MARYPKQFKDINGQPLPHWALEAFDSDDEQQPAVVTDPLPEDVPDGSINIADGPQHPLHVPPLVIPNNIKPDEKVDALRLAFERQLYEKQLEIQTLKTQLDIETARRQLAEEYIRRLDTGARNLLEGYAGLQDPAEVRQGRANEFNHDQLVPMDKPMDDGDTME